MCAERRTYHDVVVAEDGKATISKHCYLAKSRLAKPKSRMFLKIAFRLDGQ